MIDSKLAVAAVILCAVAACAVGGAEPVSPPAVETTPLACNHLEGSMTDDELTIRETTQPTISGHLVGVGNIWERELPDDQGVLEPRLSARLSIQNLTSQETRVEQVFAGSVIMLGADRYCVVNVEEGESAPGAITLRKLP
jgi:hypothetical protein